MFSRQKRRKIYRTVGELLVSAEAADKKMLSRSSEGGEAGDLRQFRSSPFSTCRRGAWRETGSANAL